MARSHSHGRQDFGRAFAVGIALNSAYVLVEGGVGLAVGSLGLVADAGHNASDVVSLLVAWIAHRLASRPPEGRFTYGLSRSPILASLFNALLLFGAMAIVAWEAVRRLDAPAPVAAGPIILVTLVGLVINSGTALLLARGRSDLNVRGAFLHMVADAAVTLGVLLSGIAMFYTGASWLDPAISLVIVAVVLWSTWDLFADAMRLSLDAVPPGVDADAVLRFLEGLPGVVEVHDLHIWGLSTRDTALTAHLVVGDPASAHARLVRDACRDLHDRFDIHHPTLQIETRESAGGCQQRPSTVL